VGVLGSYEQFPPRAVTAKDGRPLLSWRVLLLPYLGEEELFQQFKLDEPWDSPHNKRLLAKMPSVYAPVRKGKEPHSTFFQVFAGEGTIFEGTRGSRIADIRDGTAQTIIVVQAAEAVPWTKPVDLHYDAKKPISKLGGMFKDGFHFALADGTVHFAKKDFDEKTIRLAIIRNDGFGVDVRPLIADK